jgi:tripartite-type tricarboxylate transporter receptor subunit TctC
MLSALAYAQAQEKYPSRPIDIIVNFGTGGGADQLARVVSRLLEPALGVALPVSNIVGASGNTGLTKVATAQPDAYTLGTLTGISISSWAAGMGHLKVDDFAYVGVVQSSPSMLFVLADSPLKSYKDVLEQAKAGPSKLKVATAGFGTLDDFAVKYLSTKGFAMVNAPYAKPGERYTSVLGKHTQILFEEPGDVAQFLAAKQLKPIIVFGSARHPEFPDVPASAEFGHIIDLPNWRAIVASAKVPKDRVNALSVALEKAMQNEEWKKFCAQTYTCITKMDPESSRRFVAKNYEEAVAFLKDTGTKK